MPGSLFRWMLGLLVAVGVASASAGVERTLTWRDLTPKEPDVRAPFAHLKGVQFAELFELYDLKNWRRLGNDADKAGLDEEIADLTTRLSGQNLDVPALLKKLTDGMKAYRRYQSSPVPALDGQLIRLPGYVLPLEFGGQAVSEFFLVPAVGACIHTPPPPANQIVLVKLNQSYKVNGLYDAVWVTGRLKVVKSDRKLGYRDGVGGVVSTYELEGTRIVPYE